MNRMKPVCLLLCLFICCQSPVNSCTTFFINKNGELVFGRNYDWVTDAGMVCTNLRGLFKTSMPVKTGNTISWTSLHGSISFNQYGKEFPTGGMNEKGLVVELMWLDDTRYPKPDDRPALGVLQWIQYQLDNCATVEELIATDKKLRIAADGTAPLHYLVADAGGQVATIEFLKGKMVVHTGNDLPFPVLTNNRYDESIQKTEPATKPYLEQVNYGNNSLDRFARACKMVNRFTQTETDVPIVDYAFGILDKVAQGSYTRWSIVYDLAHKKIHFKTNRFPSVKSLSFSSFDLGCTAKAKAMDMNLAGSGDISQYLPVFSSDLNQKIVEKAFAESNDQVHASPDTQKAAWQYAADIQCQVGNNRNFP
ncbi:MAG TPA: linear amide C-N hydrolase [Chitinophagaceae bacterium]|nr:linear amide C-N hydrolase [Chitinophagaceae bacterium]